MTRVLYAIIGNPIAQARSPEVFNRLFAERGIDAEMIALRVTPERLSDALDGLAAIANFAGAVITIPHKTAAAGLATRRSSRVDIAGVANVLKPCAQGWIAELFDGEGFVAGLRACGHLADVPQAAIVGAGGAGLAVATALLDAGAHRVALDDVDAQRAEHACALLSAAYAGRVERRLPCAEDDLVVNATPLGMQPTDPLPINLAGLNPRALVADVIMKPPRTRLLEDAARLGLRTHEGRHMLDGQVDAIWRFLEMGTGPQRMPGQAT